jgi:hypothetical protein
VEAFARSECVALAAPSADVAARVQAVAEQLHAARTAPRPPPPSAVLSWIEETDAVAEGLARLVPPEAVKLLVPEVAEEDLAALHRLRAAVAQARWRHLARAITATGGRPALGMARFRAELAELAAEAFVPPLRGRRRARFIEWALALMRPEIGGRTRSYFDRPEQGDIPA